MHLHYIKTSHIQWFVNFVILQPPFYNYVNTVTMLQLTAFQITMPDKRASFLKDFLFRHLFICLDKYCL